MALGLVDMRERRGVCAPRETTFHLITGLLGGRGSRGALGFGAGRTDASNCPCAFHELLSPPQPSKSEDSKRDEHVEDHVDVRETSRMQSWDWQLFADVYRGNGRVYDLQSMSEPP